MKEKYTHYCGVDFTPEEIEKQTITYYTLAQMFDCILCNNVGDDEIFYDDYCEEFYDRKSKLLNSYTLEELYEEAFNYNYYTDIHFENFEDFKKAVENKEIDLDTVKYDLIDALRDTDEVYQYYLVSDEAKTLIEMFTDDVVVYNSTLDLYVWCITHFGTPWRGVDVDYTMQEALERF